MDIVFPENTGQLPQVAKRPLSFTHVLAVVYCFGGVAGVIAILSKFVTTPLFEELTYDRSVFANEARARLVELNALLGASVSRVPAPQSLRTGYVDAVVAPGERDARAAAGARAAPSPAAQQMHESLQSLRLLVKSADPNDAQLRETSLLTSQADELTRYVRSLQYEPMPGTFMPQVVNAAKETEAQALGRAIVQCKNDIRALKGSLLSS